MASLFFVIISVADVFVTISTPDNSFSNASTTSFALSETGK